MKKSFQKIYTIFCFFYREIATFYNHLILKKKSYNIKINPPIYFDFTHEYNVKSNLKRLNSKYLNFEFQEIEIFNQEGINYLIKELFTENFREFISSKTGFNYSIDFFLCYKNFPIPKSKSNQSIYANKLHFDKPYSKDMLKIIIPINVINADYGPLALKIKSPNNKNLNFSQLDNFKAFYCSKSENTLIHAFFPSRVYHKAFIPQVNKYCYQIMLQLNPSKEWGINTKIEGRQYKKEPKFVEINYLFDKRISLNNI